MPNFEYCVHDIELKEELEKVKKYLEHEREITAFQVQEIRKIKEDNYTLVEKLMQEINDSRQIIKTIAEEKWDTIHYPDDSETLCKWCNKSDFEPHLDECPTRIARGSHVWKYGL